MSSKVIDLSMTLRSVHLLQTRIRDQDTSPREFARYARRLMTIICEESIAASNPTQRDVVTPTGSVFNGIDVDESSMVAISIIRAGDSMLDVFLSVNPDAVVGKILIQRDEATAQPVLFYNKVPSLVGKKIVVLDPMLATGGSAKVAIKICLDKGAQIENMVFANVVASPEGIANLHSEFPDLTIVTAQVDVGLNEKKYIIPGLGDFGDRFFGTV